MPASPVNTWNLLVGAGGPRRPSVEDMGGALVKDAVSAPDKASMPYGDQLNAPQWAAPALGKMIGSAAFDVDFDGGGVPFISSFTTAGDLPDLGTFTVVDGGNGDTTIEWPAGTFPAPTTRPQATVNADGDTTITAVPVSNGVRVRTRTAGVLTNVAFTVEVTG